MSLHVYKYRKDVPSDINIILSNDMFFVGHPTIPMTPLADEILKVIDCSSDHTETTFVPRTQNMGSLFAEHLSTGTKTLLNILQYPHLCFNVAECGVNALNFLPKITEGHILWEIPVTLYTGDSACDIVINARHFTDFYEFLNYCYYDAP